MKCNKQIKIVGIILTWQSVDIYTHRVGSIRLIYKCCGLYRDHGSLRYEKKMVSCKE